MLKKLMKFRFNLSNYIYSNYNYIVTFTINFNVTIFLLIKVISM